MTPSHSAVTPSPPLSTVYRLPSTVCWLFILTFALFFSSLALQQHHAFQTNGLDLGNVDQALWNTAQGQFLQFSLMTPIENRLALHVEPILLLFVPFYWVGLGGPELLLIAQATVVALGAWPVYQLAMVNGQWSTVNGQRSIVNEENSITNYQLPPSFNPWLALTFPLIYLLLPTLQSAVLFDFHAITLAPTFFCWRMWPWFRVKRRVSSFI
ncbi:MAG: DUF2079 domain-containing protein [Anaerolineae bacterium]|nr:DUF2079 domain-containing protein [Anaerolineae bacterium]